uniref:Protocadherin beta 16 n=1 Tax=Aotus nancymaae TaxID=37293 RepID=A0A2K5DS36_AOTNA
MEIGWMHNRRQRQVLVFFVLLSLSGAGAELGPYSIVEETERGSFVANLGKDLGLGLAEMSSRGARIISQGNKQHLQLKVQTGDLLINEKLDREELCGPTEPCILHFQVLMEKPLEIFQAELRVIDINDHSPVFTEKEMVLKIPENSPLGTEFPLYHAVDMDIGSNNVQNYKISPSSYFRVLTRERNDGRKYPELVLDKELDREEEPQLRLTLTALDGGSPLRSGTTQVLIEVVDSNDNAPEFEEPIYKVQIPENSPLGSLVTTVSARDLDSGANGKISYALFQPSEDYCKTLEVNPITGEIRLRKQLDFETTVSYEVDIKATDGGRSFRKVHSSPAGGDMSALTSPIPETRLRLNLHPFGQRTGQRSKTPASSKLPYTCLFRGDNSPPCNTARQRHRTETPGTNAQVTYSLLCRPRTPQQLPCRRSIPVGATDPARPLCAVLVLDANDNLALRAVPLQQGSGACTELVPPAASRLLVTKVVAVDGDSGPERLACRFRCSKPRSPAFRVWAHNGEGRAGVLCQWTMASLRARHRHAARASGGVTALLPALLCPPGGGRTAQPRRCSLTSTWWWRWPRCRRFFLFSSAPVVSDFAGYLRQAASVGRCSVPEGPFPGHLVDVSGTGTLSQSYQYEVCLAGASGTNEFKFLKPILPNI